MAAKIVFVVFVSTLLTAVVVSGISVYSSHGLLRGRIEREFPSLLAETSEHVASWLREGRSELERLASDPSVRRAMSQRNPAGGREALLDQVLQQTDTFDTLALLDSSGETLVIATRGDLPPPLAPLAELAAEAEGAAIGAIPAAGDATTPAAAIRLVHRSDRVLGTLCGVFHRGGLREMLASVAIGARGTVLLVDESGRTQLGAAGAPGGEAPLAAQVLEATRGEVLDFRSHAGERMIGAALPLGELGWTIVVQQPYEDAFRPMIRLALRLLVIDVSVLLLFGLVAYRVTTRATRPIEALSKGARRISYGELDVVIPESPGSDEIGLLTRTFNDMTRRLLHQRTEIEQANRKLVAQNDELQRANEILEQLSITDGLTRLHNHRFFQEHLTREIKRVERSGEPLSLLLLDIDDFKQLNDQFGHVAGDELLMGIAQVLNQAMRDSDLLARYGGEEFAVLASNTDLKGAVHLAEKIRTAVAEAAFIVGDSMRPTRMTISIGVAQYRGSRKQLLRATDRALYRAKGNGKDCVEADEAGPSISAYGVPPRET
jgi:diguanylate cyclase (GGDEF)-like protein